LVVAVVAAPMVVVAEPVLHPILKDQMVVTLAQVVAAALGQH
jgi:hypothetical protein